MFSSCYIHPLFVFLCMQVFEWCRYLVLSKMENITRENSTVITCGVEISGVQVLEPMQFKRLQAHYKLSNSQFTIFKLT